jgi:tetratricopeptide (TPR) repeat protein
MTRDKPREVMSELETLLQKNDVAGARKLADDRLAANPHDVDALLVRARIHIAENQLVEADGFLGRAHERDPAAALVWLAILAERVRHPDALDMLKEVCETSTRPEPYIVLGRALNDREQWNAARPYLEKALALVPESADAHLQLAYTLVELDKGAEAVTHLERCLEIAPRYVPPYIVLARVLQAMGKAADAKQLIERGLKLQPQHPALRKELTRLGG